MVVREIEAMLIAIPCAWDWARRGPSQIRGVVLSPSRVQKLQKPIA